MTSYEWHIDSWYAVAQYISKGAFSRRNTEQCFVCTVIDDL